MSLDQLLSNDSSTLDFPTIRPTLDLNFARTKTLDPRITFTRSSSGSYVDPNGIIKYAGVNQPRFDHDPTTGESLGLLIEESRTNLFTYSEDFSNASWGKFSSTVSNNVEISPNGTLTAALIKATSVFDFHSIFKVPTLTANKIYTLSFFVKPAGITSVFLLFGSGSFLPRQQNATFDLLTGAISNISSGSSASAIKYPNGWWRVSLTSVTTIFSNPTPTAMYVGKTQFTGNQISGVYIWGAQLEEGAFSTSYIPTTISTRTRNADSVQMTGTNFSSWYNSSEGTLYAAARVNALGGSVSPGIAYVDDGTSNNSIGFFINDAVNDKIGAESYVSNIAQYNLDSSSAITANKLNKVISSYSINNFSASFNASIQVQRGTFGSIPTVNRLRIGALRGGLFPLNGTISRLTYYPKRLPNSQLQALTK